MTASVLFNSFTCKIFKHVFSISRQKIRCFFIFLNNHIEEYFETEPSIMSQQILMFYVSFYYGSEMYIVF